MDWKEGWPVFPMNAERHAGGISDVAAKSLPTADDSKTGSSTVQSCLGDRGKGGVIGADGN